MKVVTLTLTMKQAQKLEDVLWDHCDEGPEHEGWPSDELVYLRNLIREAVREA